MVETPSQHRRSRFPESLRFLGNCRAASFGYLRCLPAARESAARLSLPGLTCAKASLVSTTAFLTTAAPGGRVGPRDSRSSPVGWHPALTNTTFILSSSPRPTAVSGVHSTSLDPSGGGGGPGHHGDRF